MSNAAVMNTSAYKTGSRKNICGKTYRSLLEIFCIRHFLRTSDVPFCRYMEARKQNRLLYLHSSVHSVRI